MHCVLPYEPHFSQLSFFHVADEDLFSVMS